MKKVLVVLLVVLFAVAAPAIAQEKPAAPAEVAKALDSAKDVKVTAFPAVDIIKAADSYVIIAELAGVDSKNINLELVEGEKNYVEITGTKEDVTLAVKGDKIVKERHIGKFTRKIDFVERVSKEKITADFKDGILIVTVPVQKAQTKTQIKIGK